MGTSDRSNERWERIVAELRAYREAQAEVWGGLDDLTLAAYIAGSCSDEEKARVERIKESKPEVGELVNLVQELIRQPIWAVSPAALPSEAKALWEPAGQVQKLVGRLAVWLDQAGTALTAGLTRWQVKRAPAFGLALGRGAGAEQQAARPTWHVWLPDFQRRLTVEIWPSETAGGWNLRLKLHSETGTPPRTEPWFEVRSEAGRVEHSQQLASDAIEPFFLSSGRWRLMIVVDEQRCEIPISLGEPATDKE